MKKFLCFFSAFILAGCALKNDVVNIQISDQKYSLEISRADDERAKGLSNRKFLSENSGMLFVFDNKSTQVFWMKDTLIPLQIIFLDNCKIVDMQQMLVEQNPSKPDTTYQSKKPANMAIELNINSLPDNLIGTEINGLCNNPIINI
jgi:uncharacterized membrane protein (UPF0127 family)